jgi:cyanobactin maturation PatA/PatG family protease
MVNYLAGYPRPQPPFPSQGGFPKLPPQAFPEEFPKVPPKYPGFEASPWDAAELIWTLNIELTPIYAIRPAGGFTAEVYQRLVEFLDGQTRNPEDEFFIERVSVPGYLSGETVCLFSGQVVPVLVPSLRGLFGWNVNQLIEAVESRVRARYKKLTPEEIKKRALPSLDDATDNVQGSLRNFLNRIYFDLRNLGQTPAERALNFSATNAFQAAEVFADPASQGMQLDCITVERSPFCRKDSDCWDVKLKFFDPENDRRARLVSRFTVDVSDVFPVLVGPVRTWSESGLPCY